MVQNDEPEVSLGWLIKSLARGAVDMLRSNKLAAVLAAATMAVLLILAFDSRFDGLSDYQGEILPRLLRLETVFHKTLKIPDNTPEDWRRYYFETAHSQVRDILRAARLDRPQSYVARRRHRDFIRYYDLIDEEFHNIELQMKVDPNFDYLRKLTTKMEELKPIRNRWAQWALKNATTVRA